MSSVSSFCDFIFKLQERYIKRFRYQKLVYSQALPRALLHSGRKTIYALATSPGISAVSIVRISGPNASDVLYKMCEIQKLPTARRAVLCRIKDPKSNELLDKALTIWFPSPNSFTGEDVCELHIHGSRAVTRSVLTALQKFPCFRVAEPGEFTKRAFLAGKLDFTEVEGLADLLTAETEAQQKQALRQMDGVLHKFYDKCSNRIKKCLAAVEAYIDFSEDQALTDKLLSEVGSELSTLKRELGSHLQDKRRGEKLRSGVHAVLIGKPNVGKSSLLNNLCQRDIAIVSSAAGTTRDIIETSFNLEGFLVNISDTAGIRETNDAVESEGVKRTRKRLSMSDVVIFIVEAKTVLEYTELFKSQVDVIRCLLHKELGDNGECFNQKVNVCGSSDTLSTDNAGDQVILVINKIDMLCQEDLKRIQEIENSCSSICAISCTKGTGMDTFLDVFSIKVKEICWDPRGEEPVITNDRQRHYVRACLQYLLEYEEFLNYDIAIAADKLRCAMSELGKITGKVTTDDILDVIFKDFCIGK